MSKLSKHADEIYVAIKQLPFNTQVMLAKDLKVASLKEKIKLMSSEDQERLLEQLASDHRGKQYARRTSSSKKKADLGHVSGEEEDDEDMALHADNEIIQSQMPVPQTLLEKTPIQKLATQQVARGVKRKPAPTRKVPVQSKGKKREREPDEVAESLQESPKKHSCSVCKEYGHTMRSCVLVKQLRDKVQIEKGNDRDEDNDEDQFSKSHSSSD